MISEQFYFYGVTGQKIAHYAYRLLLNIDGIIGETFQQKLNPLFIEDESIQFSFRMLSQRVDYFDDVKKKGSLQRTV